MNEINQSDCAYMKDNGFICGCERDALIKISSESNDNSMRKWIKNATLNANDVSLRLVLRVCALCSTDPMLREVAICFLRENIEKISVEVGDTYLFNDISSDYEMYHMVGDIVDTF